MKARLIKDVNGGIKLLFRNGTICNGSLPVLANLIQNFNDVEHFEGKDGNWQNFTEDMAFYPGETVAIVTDDSSLVIYSGDVFSGCFDVSLRIGTLLSTEEYAAMHNKTQEIIKAYCRQGRIQGAQKVGRAWMIPKDAPYPVPQYRQRPKSCGPRPKEESSQE